MVQVVGLLTAEDRIVGGNEADIMGDDVLSRLRHLRSTLNECRRSVERVDGYLLHRHILPAGDTFFPTFPEDPFTPHTKPGDHLIHQPLLGDSLVSHAHTDGALKSHVNLEDALEPRANPEDALEPHANPEDALEPHANPEDALEPHANPEDALEPHANPEDALEPRANPEEALEPHVNPEDALEPHANPEDALEPHADPEEALEPHANPEEALDLPVILTEGGSWDTQSEHAYSMADEATTRSEDIHHSRNVYDEEPSGAARTRPHYAVLPPGEPLTSSTKQLKMSVQEDQQQKTKNEEANIEEQTNLSQMMRKDPMSEVKEAEEHVDRTQWTVMVGELAEDLDIFKDVVEDVITVGRLRRKLIKQPNIEDDEGIISHNDLEDKLGTRDIYGQKSEESKLIRTISHEELRVLGEAEEREPRDGDSRSLADLHLSQSAHHHCNTCVDLNLEKVKCFIISLQNSLGYSVTTVRRHHRTTSGGSPRETETTTDLMAAARPAPAPTSGSSTGPLGPLGVHSQPKEFSSQARHPPLSHCSHEAHLSSCPTHPLLGRSKWHLKDSLAIVVVILLLLLVLIFLACCLMLVVPVVTIRSLQGPAAF
nr:uncharacterized protein LOC123760867 [Procambarus clarkii]